MGKEIKDQSRVTVFKLIHMWRPRQVAVAAYASTGHYGDTAVVGYIPIVDVADVSWMDVAARHGSVKEWRSPVPGHTQACWILCTATSGRIVPKRGTLDLLQAAWSLEPQTTVSMAEPMYGHRRLVVGRFNFEDEALMAQARSLLSPAEVPRMTETDVPAYSV